MAQIASWNGHTFEVSSQLIRSFRDLTLKGSCETEGKTSGNQEYAKRKKGKGAELTISVALSALLGVTDVRSEALAYVKEANDGASEYFYLGTQKLVEAKMMLTNAEVTEYICMPGNADEWISCDVKLTFKQAGKGSAGKKKKKKKSNRSKGAKKESFWKRTADEIMAAAIAAANAIPEAGKNGSRNKLPRGTAGSQAASLFSKNTNKVRNSSTRKNPTTGRATSGSMGVKLKQTR